MAADPSDDACGDNWLLRSAESHPSFHQIDPARRTESLVTVCKSSGIREYTATSLTSNQTPSSIRLLATDGTGSEISGFITSGRCLLFKYLQDSSYEDNIHLLTIEGVEKLSDEKLETFAKTLFIEVDHPQGNQTSTNDRADRASPSKRRERTTVEHAIRRIVPLAVATQGPDYTPYILV